MDMNKDYGKILEIKEIHLNFDKNIGKLSIPAESHFSDYGGFEIVTDKVDIKFLIQDWAQCCERWGYIYSFDFEEELKYYIGATLYKVKFVDLDNIISDGREFAGEPNKDKILSKYYNDPNEFDVDDFCQSVIFIDCYTSRGVFTE